MAMIITLPVLGNEANAADKWLAKQGRISLRDALGAGTLRLSNEQLAALSIRG